jgi:hypothetical protein
MLSVLVAVPLSLLFFLCLGALAYACNPAGSGDYEREIGEAVRLYMERRQRLLSEQSSSSLPQQQHQPPRQQPQTTTRNKKKAKKRADHVVVPIQPLPTRRYYNATVDYDTDLFS